MSGRLLAETCARAMSGHVAAAPPSSVMNLRRFMPNMGSSSPVIWRRHRSPNQQATTDARFAAR
jgi:hypothetical protein